MRENNLLVLGAGQGSRMGALTRDRPKLGIEFSPGLRLIDVLAFATREFQWQQEVVVLGHKAENVPTDSFERVINADFASTNMAYSLLLGMRSLRHRGDTIVVYGDLILDSDFLKPLVDNKNKIAVASLEDFQNIWSSRFINPEEDAESFLVDGQGLIREIGKPIRNLREAQGQFGGCIRISADATENFVENLEGFCLNKPKAFLTDFLQLLIESGEEISAVTSRGIWYELDSPEDLEFALESSEVQALLEGALAWRRGPDRKD